MLSRRFSSKSLVVFSLISLILLQEINAHGIGLGLHHLSKKAFITGKSLALGGAALSGAAAGGAILGAGAVLGAKALAAKAVAAKVLVGGAGLVGAGLLVKKGLAGGLAGLAGKAALGKLPLLTIPKFIRLPKHRVVKVVEAAPLVAAPLPAAPLPVAPLLAAPAY